ncbi:OmpH family outer membrane protein [Legionella impletisoli]|uniref:Membrane protein n=1 Tax=Legionella impletisoli TaxID=343510 RepID=A0A917JXX0_9GAMM|nr:OmpH family outer membrane protein [Legionella impletisoli]GGI89703.1 membrane protein [Legionella impletisoli]
MKRFGLLLAVLFSISSAAAFADSSKIGVVDLQKIMQNSPHMKEIQGKLEKEFKPRRDKLVAAEESLKADMDKFKRESAVMSEKQRKELERKIVAAQQQFEREGQQYQQELSAAHNEQMEAFYNKIRDAIVKVAKSDKYDIVLQKDAAPYSADKLDVTDKVMKEIK